MGKLVGSTGQYTGGENLFDASGTITTGGTAQLILPKARSRSSLLIQNTSSVNMLIEIGSARATATLTNGAVTSCTVTNAGFGFSRPPKITFLGGAYTNPTQVTPTFAIPGLPDFHSPSYVAKAHCVMTGTAPNQVVSSIVIDDPGAGYAYPPYVFITNDHNDAYGCAIPSATVGIELVAAGGSYNVNGTICTTDQISVFCATTGSTYVCKYSV